MQRADDREKGLFTIFGLERDQLAEHVDVAAGAEMRAGAAQQHNARGGILGGFGCCRGELGDQLAVGRVQHRRTVQNDLENGLMPLYDNIGHCSAP